MATATLTTKGQITIPKSVRDSLRLRSGDRITFVLHGDSEAILKPMTKSVEDMFGTLHKPSQQRLTVTEMNAVVANKLWWNVSSPTGGDLAKRTCQIF